MNLLAVNLFVQEVIAGLIIILVLFLDMWRKGKVFKEINI